MSKGFENRAENSIKDTRPPVKDSVLELRPRMARMMSIVDITPRDRRLVAALAIRFFSFFLFFFLLAINDEQQVRRQLQRWTRSKRYGELST